ncbi:MAG: glycosyltransferase family 4 protein [Faecousia sp.]
MKKILITSTDMMMIQFLVPHVRNLSEHGFRVEIACSEVGGRMDDVRSALSDTVAAIHTVRLERSPTSLRNLAGCQDMKRLLKENHYDIIWTNEPVMGVVTRLAARKARKTGTKVVYMCHGFHFFKGAGKKNWLIFYPVERLMANLCDVIVTINREDEALAKSFHAGRVAYIHGIGVNTQRLRKFDERSNIRTELNLTEEDFLVLSVGELNENKNHQVILRALARLRDDGIHYIICGKGELWERLQTMVRELKLEANVHFLGYRKDVAEICLQADVFAFPTRREGLGLAALEAMYCGLPVIASNTRGIQDYMVDGKSGFLRDAEDAAGFADAIRILKEDIALRKRCGAYNMETVKAFCLEPVKDEVLALFTNIEM